MKTQYTRRLVNVKIPARLSDAIARVARELGTSKTKVVIALLNAGLERAAKIRRPLGQQGTATKTAARTRS